MAELHTDKILMEIYKERKTFVNFFDSIIGFLIRNTSFGLIPIPDRTRLQEYIFKTFSAYDPVIETNPSVENVATEGLTVVRDERNEDVVPKTNFKSGIVSDNLYRKGNNSFNNSEESDSTQFNISRPEEQCSEQHTKKFRTILPKTEKEVDTNTSASIQILNSAKLKNRSKRVYNCGECSDKFTAFRQLKAHENLHINQTDLGISICKYCCSLYANAETLEKHINESHMDGRYVCVPCAKLYKSRGLLLKHVLSNVHTASALLYYCSLCPRSEKVPTEFVSRASLQQHYQETHLLMPVNQDEDDVKIEMNEEFLDEFLLSNVNENSFNFSECWDALDLNLPDMLHLTNTDEKCTDTKDSTVLNSQLCFKCPKCFEGFLNQKTLLQHIAHKHELPVLICNKCDASFKDYTQLIHHKSIHHVQSGIERTVTGKLLKCEICDKIFRSNAALNYHVKTHLRIFLDAPHECPYCRKTFYTDTNLKQHIRVVHSQIKRHTCELCDKPFATLDHLKKHVLSQHQNERKHICHICAKSFTQLCHLKQHLAIHTTGKTHQCLKCEEKFWRKIDVQRHMLKKHT
ncbi:zinc finger protein 883 [Bactrocera dorsalis]|uniref:Zinc finger protein 883 n=1 Tax=Bactrocera dorsalis TaxID=27457 RepID=A0A6I9VTJ9_BACDO|nr:zinc finger protein 883 [Bactrocera dorsalis]